MIKKLFYLSVVFFIVILPSVSALCVGEGMSAGSNLDACFTLSNKDISGRGPNSITILGTIENTNGLICSMDCSYRTSQGKTGYVGTIGVGGKKSFPIEIEIPTTGNSPQTIGIYAECKESDMWGCGNSGEIPESLSLTYTYCGDGNIDQGYETCSNCIADAGCQSGYICENNVCVQKCGNGKIDSGENCQNCAADVKCASGTRCESSQCVTYCGNKICESNENCFTCASDCMCASGYSCKSGTCEKNILCGDNQCASTESCSSCPVDCGKCPSVCGNGACETDESCSSCMKDCGSCPKTDSSSSIKSIANTNNPETTTTSSESEQEQKEKGGFFSKETILKIIKNPIFIIVILLIIVALILRKLFKRNEDVKKIKKGLLNVCHKCGKKLDKDDLFCIGCGQKVKRRG